MLSHTGNTPLQASESMQSFEEIRAKADRPVVVFPEGTTSNARGLLRFAEVFKGIEVPVKHFKVFITCVRSAIHVILLRCQLLIVPRYDPPTSVSPSLSHSIPSFTLNPLPHIFTVATSLVPLNISIRLLDPAESPSSGSFLLSDFLTNLPVDPLSEVCAALVAQTGKLKRVGMGWEDKAAFFEFYRAKK